MTRPSTEVVQHPRVLLVMIEAPYNKTSDIQSYFDEFVHLVETNGIVYEDKMQLRLREIDPGYFLTKGLIEKIDERRKELDIDEIIISEPLTPRQDRNLRDMLHRPIFDRTQLILEIFEKTAKSAEGKAQVKIAMLQHKKARLAGQGISLAQQRGVVGMRAGSGETQKEQDARHLEQAILDLKKHLVKLESVRDTQRKRRLVTQIPNICLVGYTNAGKSTILNTLTKAGVLAEDKLFATLDTTTRALFVDHKQVGVLSDTVGFIQLLPPHLIEAFKSTLSELQYADLLLHVVDLANPNWEYHIRIVQKILSELGVDKETLYLFNKVDRVEMTDELKARLEQYQPQALIDARARETMEPLIEFLKTWKPVRSA